MVLSKINLFNSILITIFLLVVLVTNVSAGTTFFDQDDAFIMGDSTTGGTISNPAESQNLTSAVTSNKGGTISKTTITTESVLLVLDMDDKTIFTVKGQNHYAQLKRLYKDHVIVTIHSFDAIDVELYKDATKKVDINKDGVDDLAMTLKEIYTSGAKILFEPLPKKATTPEAIPEKKQAAEVKEEAVTEAKPGAAEELPPVKKDEIKQTVPLTTGMIILALGTVALIAISFRYMVQNKKKAKR